MTWYICSDSEFQYASTEKDGEPCADCRPVVVIDPEDREASDALMALWRKHRESDNWSEFVPFEDRMQLALREYANPKPEVEQPTRVGALVEATFATALNRDASRTLWSLAEDGSWCCLTDGRTSTSAGWPFLVDVKVIWDGVPTE